MSIAKSLKAAMAKWPQPPDHAYIERPFNRLEVSPIPTAPPRVAKRRKRRLPRPVDGLATFWPARPETLVAITPVNRPDVDDIAAVETGYVPTAREVHSLVKPRRPGPRGAAEIVAVLARRGIKLVPSSDGEFYVESEAGALDLATRDAIRAAAPLLRAWLHGSPLRCALDHHGEAPPEAVTLLLGGAAACEAHS